MGVAHGPTPFQSIRDPAPLQYPFLVQNMTTITLEFEPTSFGALRLAPQEFTREIRIAAAVQWYAQGIVSQGKAAECAGLARTEFLDELRQRRVPACQFTAEEIREEIHGD